VFRRRRPDRHAGITRRQHQSKLLSQSESRSRPGKSKPRKLYRWHQRYPGCAETLLTGTPIHIAIGSLAPQNGTAAGLAFTEMYHPTYCASWIDFSSASPVGTRNPCNWPFNLNAAGLTSSNFSWRKNLHHGYATVRTHASPALSRRISYPPSRAHLHQPISHHQLLFRNQLPQSHLLLRPRPLHHSCRTVQFRILREYYRHQHRGPHFPLTDRAPRPRYPLRA